MIKGSGGGGKSGGGAGRVASEAADSLQSKQTARVIDLVSEGEIKGLVNGLQSVFLNETPIQNADGTFNVSGAGFSSRNGTQSQSFIDGFSAVESEQNVGAKVTKASPVVRSISGADLSAVRVTASVPRLTRQNVSTGDIAGTSVTISLEIQTDGGGFLPVKLGQATKNLSVSGNIASSLTVSMIGASLSVRWTGTTAQTFQSCASRIDYRQVGNTTWIPLTTQSFSGTGYTTKTQIGTYPFTTFTYIKTAPTQEKTASFEPAIEAAYEFRAVITSGVGSLSVDGKYTSYIGTDIISGKTSSKYQRSYRVPLPTGSNWDIRFTRITDDSTSQALQNETFWDSYTEIVDAKFSYPNSAIMALSLDSSLYNSIPTRGYEIEGIIIRVPSNYDPVARTYSGIWDGTFITEYSNNPAWIFYDLIIEKRYGLGSYVTADIIDKWALYEIGQYCDEFVDDGFGGLEPRYTCNVYIQSQEEAYKVIQALSSSFAAMSYWSSGAVTAVQDSPKLPVALFTPANVIGGAFNYSGSSQRTRATAVSVIWNDPKDSYKQAVEYVEDEDSIAQFGLIRKDVSAFGCTSRGQANRFGKSILFTEKMETDTVTFKCGLDGLNIGIGEVIQTTDPIRSGSRMGGRLIAATTTSLTIDAPVTIVSGSIYTAWAIMPDGAVESATVSNGAGSTSVLILSSALTDTPLNDSIWVLGASSLVPEQWRVMSIEEEGFEAVITGLEYRADKYSAIEDGLILEELVTSSLNTVPSKPTDLTVNESLYLITNSIVGARLTISWNGSDIYYEVEYRAGDGNWKLITALSNSVDIEPVQAGNYEIKVRSVNSLGVRSIPAVLSAVVYGLTVPPSSVNGLSLQAISGNAILTWEKSLDLDVLVGGKILFRHSLDAVNPEWSNSIDIGGEISGATITVTLPLLGGTYLAKFIDSTGNKSASAVFVTTNAPKILAMNFVETITESPAFNGAKTKTIQIAEGLTLDSAETITEHEGLISTWGLLSQIGGISPYGEYLFASSTDLGSVQTSRITAQITAQGVDLSSTIANRPLISTWASIAGGDIDDVDATLYIRQSDDNSIFGLWSKFVVGDYTARAFQYKLVLESGYETHNIVIPSVSITVDMPDRLASGDDISSGVATKSIIYATDFIGLPAIGITAQNMSSGDYYTIGNKSLQGFDIIFKDSGNATVSRTFDYIARGY